MIDDVNKIATKVPFETSVEGREMRGLAREGKAVAVGIRSPGAKTGSWLAGLLKRPPANRQISKWSGSLVNRTWWFLVCDLINPRDPHITGEFPV